MAASFNDIDGKPLVFQLDHKAWQPAMEAVGFWDTLCERGANELGQAIISNAKRELILGTLAELFATGKRDQWVERLRGADIVSAPINTLLEASSDADVLANGYVDEVDYPGVGKLKVHGTPWQFSETPASIGRAPRLGEHNAEVLGRLGYTEGDLASLAERKII